VAEQNIVLLHGCTMLEIGMVSLITMAIFDYHIYFKEHVKKDFE